MTHPTRSAIALIPVAKSPWRIIFVEDAKWKFLFRLSGTDFKFEPRDKYRYPTHNDAKRAAYCFLELLKRIDRSPKRLNILMEIGILKFPQEFYRGYHIWLLVDRCRYSWEVITAEGHCFRSPNWYVRSSTALLRAKQNIDLNLTKTQILEAIGWV